MVSLGNLHPLLERQLKKSLTSDCLKNEPIRNFILNVNESYYAFDRERELFEHASKLNENEYYEINAKLKTEIAIKSEFVEKIKEAILKLARVENYVFDDNDLIGLLDILNSQIEKQKEVEEELKASKQLAEKANMAKSEFLSMMSHEIRTPLNAIVGLSYLMLEEKNIDTLSGHLKTLQFSTNNLHVLINDILDFSKIEAGKVDLEDIPFDLKYMITQIKKANDVKAEEKENKLKLLIDDDIPDVLIGDQLRLGQIINNLVSNGIKFTNKGMITIEAWQLNNNDNTSTIKIAVKDNGIGIHKDKFDLIFQQFEQAEYSTTREYGGTGLGLVITKKLLELHNSKIELESELGKGSTFSFVITLPKAKTNQKLEKKVESSQLDTALLADKKVLLVEDHPINIMIAQKFLENWKIKVTVAEDGAKALALFETDQFDLVLMDIQMPIVDGYDATIGIRKVNKTIPIIALTASATLTNQDLAFQVGMNDYITKPFNPNELLFKLKKYLSPL